MTSAPAILFLDFDGVLHPTVCTDDDHFCRLPLFEDWLRRRPGVEVVVSSAWRLAQPIGTLRSWFSPDIRLRVIGKTPNLHRYDWQGPLDDNGLATVQEFLREAEVMRWLYEQERMHLPWAALDDQAGLYRPECSRFVLCDGVAGLTERELDLVDQLLGTK